MDVKTAFLHGDLEEDIYMAQPKGFEGGSGSRLVCKLERSLNDLKQGPRQWYKKFDSYNGELGFKRCGADFYCYKKNSGVKDYIILVIYVDDMLIAGTSMKDINILKKQLSEKLEMQDLGAAKQILGMKFTLNLAISECF